MFTSVDPICVSTCAIPSPGSSRDAGHNDVYPFVGVEGGVGIGKQCRMIEVAVVKVTVWRREG